MSNMTMIILQIPAVYVGILYQHQLNVI